MSVIFIIETETDVGYTITEKPEKITDVNRKIGFFSNTEIVKLTEPSVTKSESIHYQF